MTGTEILASACQLLARGEQGAAQALLTTQLPFVPITLTERAYGLFHALTVFRRDGFVCRYSGERLVFPGTLRLLSILMPEQLPYHPNWKVTDTHSVYWQLYPTLDHVVPVTRGGLDDDTNWVTTSQLRNSAKAGWLLDELGWKLVPAGDLGAWDGLCSWFQEFVSAHPELLRHAVLRRWHRLLHQAVNQ